MHIRESGDSDIEDVLFVEKAAFSGDEEGGLARELLKDSSAQPILSLLAFNNVQPVWHILFTAACLAGPHDKASISILAPLAVVPDAQGQGRR